MTVAELIATLSELPGDALVVVDGYEGGYSDPRVYGAIARLETVGDHYVVDPDDTGQDGPETGDVACVLVGHAWREYTVETYSQALAALDARLEDR